MKRRLFVFTVSLLALCLSLGAVTTTRGVVGEIDVTGMPETDVKNRDVVVYCWSDYAHVSQYGWDGFRFEDYYGGNVETILSSGNYYETLYKLVSAGEIPDAVVAEATSFPSMIVRGLVQPWDDYIDLDDPIWEESGSLEEMDKMKWDGKYYNLSFRSHVLGVLFYNKRLIDEAGLDDPAELQAAGEWTWEVFEDYLNELTYDMDGDGIIDQYGMVNTGDFPIALFATTGELPIEYKDGKFINNMKSKKVKDAADFLYRMVNGNPRVLNLGDPTSLFLNAKAAFVYTNDYRGYEDYSKLWDTDGVGIVPLPLYKKGEPQYQAALADYFYLMKGAQNPEGAGLLALSERYDRKLNKNPNVNTPEESTIQDFMSHGFTREAAEMVVEISTMPHKIIMSRSITLKEGNLEYRAMVIPWTQLTAQASGSVDKAILDATTELYK